jgi:adenylate cyclase
MRYRFAEGIAAQQANVAPEHRINLRIAINLGDVVVEGDDLLGDGVNVDLVHRCA